MKKKIFIPISMFLALTCVATPLITLTSCGKQDAVELFEIKDGVLKGFKAELSADTIAKQLTNILEIPETVKFIADNAFYRDSKTTIPDKVKTISFSKATSLQKIGKRAFYKAPFTSLNFNNLPETNSNVVIDEYAFADCTQLTHLSISTRVAEAENFAFANLTNLEVMDVWGFDTMPTWNGAGIFTNSLKEGATINTTDDTSADIWDYYLNYQGVNVKYNVVPQVVVFDVIKTEEGSYILNGFNKSIDKDKIIERLGKKLVIADKFDAVADNAFYKDGKSTIPDGIEELSFTYLGNCSEIGENAFNNAPFKTITLDEQVETIKNNAFANLPNFNKAIIKDISAIPEGWTANAFSSLKEDGEIKTNFDWIGTAIKTYFGDFAKNWIINCDVKLLNIVRNGQEVILKGFSKELDYELISDAFDVIGDTFTIPDEVTKIEADAFIEEEHDYYRSVSSFIPFKVKTIKFTENSMCNEIGTRAFMMTTMARHKNGIKTIILPKNLQKFGLAAFQGDAIKYIDLSRCEFSSIPSDWAASPYQWYYCDNKGEIYINNDNQKEFYTQYFKDNGLGVRVGTDWIIKTHEKNAN